MTNRPLRAWRWRITADRRGGYFSLQVWSIPLYPGDVRIRWYDRLLGVLS